MVQVGKVLNVSGKYATILVNRQSACGENCAMCQGCGAKNGSGHKAVVLWGQGAAPGQMVRVEAAAAKTLLLAAITYFCPLLLLLFCFSITKSELWAAAALVAGFGLCAFFANRLAKLDFFKSKITRVLDDGAVLK